MAHRSGHPTTVQQAQPTVLGAVSLCSETLLESLQGRNVNIIPISLWADGTSKFNTHNVPRMCCLRKPAREEVNC